MKTRPTSLIQKDTEPRGFSLKSRMSLWWEGVAMENRDWIFLWSVKYLEEMDAHTR